MTQLQKFINKLKIGYKNRCVSIHIPLSAENIRILQFFYKRGWIKQYTVKNKLINVFLRYTHNKPFFFKIDLISTSGCRRYFSKESLKFYRLNLSRSALVLLYTNVGLLTLEESLNLGIGGEIIFVMYE